MKDDIERKVDNLRVTILALEEETRRTTKIVEWVQKKFDEIITYWYDEVHNKVEGDIEFLNDEVNRLQDRLECPSPSENYSERYIKNIIKLKNDQIEQLNKDIIDIKLKRSR